MRTLAAAAAALLVLLPACADKDDAAPAATPTASSSPSASRTASPSPAPSATGSATPTAAATRSPLATDLADGRHYFRLKGLDPAALTVSVDVVQFLTGKEAEQAAAEDGNEAHDYYVRNTNPRVRTLSVQQAVTVVVNTVSSAETGSSSQDKPITFAQLKAYFDQGRTANALFFLTLDKGFVTAIREQYLP